MDGAPDLTSSHGPTALSVNCAQFRTKARPMWVDETEPSRATTMVTTTANLSTSSFSDL